jgi:uncharacterized protein (TIGR02757 family)
MMQKYAAQLESLYVEKNRRCYVDPDPLMFLYQYTDPVDREIAGFTAAALAYGNVRQILKSVESVLSRMGDSPRDYLRTSGYDDFRLDFSGFVHRFATGEHVSAMLTGLKSILSDSGSLMKSFQGSCSDSDATYLPALCAFAATLRESAKADPGHLVPRVNKGSACKRLNLFLRWMIRKDDVDPGGWHALCPSKLIIPLDVHMHRISMEMGLTKSKQANMKTALEITRAFSRIVPADPVRYDFVLTRRGIRKDDDFCLLPNPE